MKPNKGKDLRQKRTATAALKREIHLRFGWLDGAPFEPPGIGIDPEGDIPWLNFRKDHRFLPHAGTISRKEIRIALRGPSHLAHAYPRAFPRHAGNVEAWKQGHLFVPNLLRNADTVPDSLEVIAPQAGATGKTALRIVGAFSELKPLVRALLWRAPHDPAAVRADLRKLDAIAPALSGALPLIAACGGDSSLIDQLRFLHLASLVSPRALKSLLELIVHPAMASPPTIREAIPLGRIREFVESDRRTGGALPSIASATQAEGLLQFARWLSEQGKPDARDCLRLFLDIFPFSLLEALDDWWRAWSDLRPFLENFYRWPAEYSASERESFARRISVLEYAVVDLPNCANAVVRSLDLPLKRDLWRFLSAAPPVLEGTSCRAVMLLHFLYLRPPQNLRPFIVRATAFFKANPPANVRGFGPWSEIISTGLHYLCPERDIAEVLKDSGQIGRYFDALGLILESGRFEPSDLKALPGLVVATENPEDVVSYFRAIKRETLERVDYGDEACLAGAVDLADNREAFNRHLESLLDLQDFLGYDRMDPALTVLRKLQAAGESEVLQQVLGEKEFRGIAYLSRLVTCLGEPPPDLPKISHRSAGWVNRYPADFRPRLAALESFLPPGHGEKRAESILGKDFPDPEKLRAELEHLRQQLASGSAAAHLEKRVRKLGEWIESSPDISPVRLDNLRKKLNRAASQCRFDAWQSDLRELAGARLAVKLGAFPDLERWIAEPRLFRHVLGIEDLSKVERKHPLRVLKTMHQSGAGIPDLCRDETANRKFLDLLERKGLDLEPWLKGIGVRTYLLKDGSELHLALEDDPLEILDMGHHFGTCLSPMGCNYFSVYANISDLNKRVVYGRSGGKVRARCLLALCEEGTVLVFNPYSHGLGTEFVEIVTDFAESLAAAIGTVVTPRGHVPSLVAPDWYDDGPRDVGSRFAFLRDDSDFRKALPTIDPDNLRDRLFQEISSFDALTIPYVIHLPEITERPELIRPLMRDIQSAEAHLPAGTLVLAADLADRAGESAFARELARRHAPRMFRGERNLYLADQWTAIWLLARHFPSLALNLLRKSRPRGIRTWEQECPPAILAAAECYDRLLRPSHARRLFGCLEPSSFEPEREELILRRRRELGIE